MSRRNIKPITYCLMISLCLANGFAHSRQARSSSQPRRSTTTNLPEDLIRQLMSDDAGVRAYVNEDHGRLKNFEARLIDLNGDRKPEYEVYSTDPASPFCFVEGNCASWLCRKVGDGWKFLLTTDGPVSPLQTSTNGYRDISRHSSVGATHEYTTIYKFDGRRYQAKECFEYEYTKVSRSGVPFARKLVSRGPCKN